MPEKKKKSVSVIRSSAIIKNPVLFEAIGIAPVVAMAVSLKSVIENPANKYVLVDFWASWCGPCLREIPYLQADYEKYRKKGFEIYAVSLDDERDAWVKTIADKQMKWIQVCDFKAFDSPASLDYAVESIPSNFLIRCSDGQIVARKPWGRASHIPVGEIEKLLGQ